MELKSTCRKGRGRIVGARGVEGTTRTQPTESTKEDSQGLRDWNTHHGACMDLNRPLHSCYGCLWGGGVSDSAALGTLFLPLGCFIQPCYAGLCLVLLHPGMPCLVDITERSALFWKEEMWNGYEGHRRLGELGRVEGGQTAAIMHCSRLWDLFQNTPNAILFTLNINLLGCVCVRAWRTCGGQGTTFRIRVSPTLWS